MLYYMYVVNLLERKKGAEISTLAQPEVQAPLESSQEKQEIQPVVEKEDSKMAERPKELPTRAPAQQASGPIIQKDKILIGIEHILSENLADAYVTMSPEKRTAFKKRGEEIATKVKVMVDKGHVHVRKVLRWIRDWLRMIPGVNSFFLEQEAKIKADKLLEYYKRQSGE